MNAGQGLLTNELLWRRIFCFNFVNKGSGGDFSGGLSP
jgi:hypothetical protein